MKHCSDKLVNLESDNKNTSGFIIAELVIGMVVFSMIAVSFLGLYAVMIQSTLIGKKKAVASNLATNQMEYLKSLPYNSLAVVGGAIQSSNPLPNSTTTTINGITYTTKTSINFVDDAYDGCGSYPTPQLKQLYCRNFPSPAGAPSLDLNPGDYKIVHVSVFSPSDSKIAEVDTQFSARVAETANTTGALFVKVVDSAGNPLSGASVQVANTTISPNVNSTDSTDSNGIAIFYGLSPDTVGFDYVVSATLSQHSSLTTIPPAGSLQPFYSSQKVLTQASSFVTLTLKPQSSKSLIVETTDTSGSVLANAKIYVKGGYKKYTDTGNTNYYYDNLTPTDVRPTSDASGLFALENLTPGPYFFCGDSGTTSCTIGGTSYYLAAAVPYSGSTLLSPVAVPTYIEGGPPVTTFSYGSDQYVQKARLMLTTVASFPRLTNISPSQISISDTDLSSFAFTVNGVNLPCSAIPTSCATSVNIVKDATTYSASCTGSAAGTSLSCSVDLTGITTGITQISVSSGSHTLTLPSSPMIGGFDVIQ
ncbi:hypothetical protein KA068_01250 [Candidatus Saccharibacteria bacterium]|jgi:type II secretory pathway pseudopilin PulG|nr:hypothetical protein [Candidatus Saccharibacteria bacterium]